MNRSSVSHTETHLPGEFGIWLFVIGDMSVFGLLFGTYMFYRADSPDLYAQSQLALNKNFGALNTLLLLCSSWLVAMAVQHAKAGRGAFVPVGVAGAFCCGAGFAIIKIIEYWQKFAAGITPSTNDFYMFYFVLTGVHFLHLLFGMGVLAYMWLRFRICEWTPGDQSTLESGASFWHLIDLLWIVLFPLLYLLR
ncbi:MAG TPA: cytochrome c oxidase subunit 3 family protein [Steroidobacteraceae bacterium]|jgi:nitric oxide reductase NorE protein